MFDLFVLCFSCERIAADRFSKPLYPFIPQTTSKKIKLCIPMIRYMFFEGLICVGLASRHFEQLNNFSLGLS